LQEGGIKGGAKGKKKFGGFRGMNIKKSEKLEKENQNGSSAPGGQEKGRETKRIGGGGG